MANTDLSFLNFSSPLFMYTKKLGLNTLSSSDKSNDHNTYSHTLSMLIYYYFHP